MLIEAYNTKHLTIYKTAINTMYVLMAVLY